MAEIISNIAAWSGWGAAVLQFVVGKKSQGSNDEREFRRDILARLSIVEQDRDECHRKNDEMMLKVLELERKITTS